MKKGSNFIVLAASIVLTLLLTEGVFTFIIPSPEAPDPPFSTCDLTAYIKNGTPGYHPNQECMQCYWRNPPMDYFDRRVIKNEKTYECVRYLIRENGFRTPPFDISKPEGKRVVILGDSFTFGEGVKEEDTFPRLIQSELGLETVNLSMQGLNTHLERMVFQKQNPLPSDLVILTYIINDTMPVMETIRAGAKWAENSRIPDWARASRALTFFYRRINARRQTRHEIENLTDWFQRGWIGNAKEILNLRKIAEEKGARFLLVLFPFLIELDTAYPFADAHRMIGTFARENGISYLDLLPAFKGKNARDYWVHPMDLHPNAAGHRIAFNEIQRWLSMEILN
ncbi:hypothetical protein UR09_04840 [Candidatus Nitromaritima sp. SCGC AAA799-A02]|nr:hypothetical protein UR09_04840 [Candidatus Nitromaritima sp. SCGC AAA799-A02]